MKWLFRLWMVFMAGWLGACAGPVSILDERPDIELTWARAVISLPAFKGGQQPLVGRLGDSTVTDRLADLPSRARLPVVLYSHGCTGIGNFDFFRALSSVGYAVIGPDSMARRYRPLQCDPKTRTGGYNRFVYDFRLTEISFALDRMRKLPWVDMENLFLIGISEGGVAAALYRGDEFRARVIAQWTCTGAPIVEGLDAPREEPVLALVRRADPWYDQNQTHLQRGDCGTFMFGRPGSQSLVLDDSDNHILLDSEHNRRLVINFLNANRAR